MKAEATIRYDGLTPEGDLKFSVPLREIGLSRAAIRRPETRSKYFVNLVGEVLVRKNIALFAEVLEKLEPTDYDRRVNCYRHRHFGMTVETDDRIHFQFHSSLIQRILTEDLEEIL